MSTRRATLSDVENLVVGAGGGVIETCVQMPLITYKICVQEGRALPSSMGGWYRGVFANASSLAPITAMQMAANGAIERVVTQGKRDMSDAEKIGVAMGAGSVSALLYGPVDLIVIQQQKLGLGAGGTVSHLVSTYGPLSLWRGFMSTVVREAIYTAGYLGLTPIAKDFLQKSHPVFEKSELTASIVGSCIGGTVAAVLTHPVDTAKTCVQGDMSAATYKSARQAMGLVYEKGGVGALYSGGLARTARLCGAFFIINNIREAFVQYKSKHLDDDA